LVEQETNTEPKAVVATVRVMAGFLPQLSDTEENTIRPQRAPK